MKRIILILLVWLISTQVEAITCVEAGGVTIKGNNNAEYCKSSRPMNWWTAMAWCQKIQKTAFRYPQDCSCETDTGIPCPGISSACPNLKEVGTDTIWTSTPSGDKDAIYIDLASGSYTYLHYGNRASKNYYALCR